MHNIIYSRKQNAKRKIACTKNEFRWFRHKRMSAYTIHSIQCVLAFRFVSLPSPLPQGKQSNLLRIKHYIAWPIVSRESNENE